MKIGIFGGTFDPIHEGHLFLARAARDQYHLDKILFVPAFIPPHKTGRRDMTPAPYRYSMVEMGIRDERDFEVSDIEFNRPEVSYTVDTLRAFKTRYPDDEFFLITGSDTAVEIPGWREPEEIKKMASVLVAGRPGHAAGAGGSGLLWIDMPPHDISSSEIRRKIAAGEPIGEKIISQNVENYIRKMKLYQSVKS